MMQKQFSFFLLTLTLTIGVFAQSGKTVSLSVVNSPAKTVFGQLQDQTGTPFFYQENWLDSISFTAQFSNLPLETALQQLLENTSLSFVFIDNRVILTQNVVIIQEPALLQSLKDVRQQQPTSIEKGLVFSREYLQQTKDAGDLENYVFEIGSRTAMQSGNPATVAGYVKSRETGDPVVGALVYIENPFKATSTDESGFYSLTLPSGKHTVLIQYVGMKTTKRNIVLFSSGKLNVDMDVDVIALQEITIESDRDKNVKNVQMGVSKISMEESKTVPIVLGENDIMKIATTKPGVQTVGEGAAGFNVRGGKTDQNMIMINDAPVYNSSHFFGFFSVFNSDAIAGMELFKSGIPAKYGGRLSSIFEITSKSANTKEFKGQGGISPITSRLTLEIPLKEDKTSLLVGGRTTYSNWILRQSKSAGFRENKVSFYDLILRLDHKIDEKNDVTFSSYISKDKFRLNSDTLFSFSDFSFVNANGSLKWNHQFNGNLDGSFAAVYSHYGYDLLYDESEPNAFTQDFGISEASVKGDLSYYIDNLHRFNVGASIKRYDVNPGSKNPYGSASNIVGQTIPEEQGLENALYFSDQYELSDNISLYGGLRYSIFNVLGPQNVYSYASGSAQDSDNKTDSTAYKSGSIIKTYHGPEWRLSGRYSIDKVSSLKLSISRNRQYVHTMSNSASLSPTDTWRLSSYYLKPQVADQIALGYFRNFLRSTLEFSVETYYKKLQNLVDFKTGATFLLNENIERAILQGPGKSYGVEFSLTKSGRLNGWLNYAYARTFIQLNGNSQEETINDGKFFPTSYDKPHTINLVGNYKVTRRLSVSMNTTYNTGRPVTIPVAVFEFKGFENKHYSDRNAYRIPDYFRVDLGVNLEGNHRVHKLSHSFWSLSIYNLTGRDNPFSVFFDIKDGKVQGYQLIVFGNPIPTLSYNFKF